MKFKPLLTLMTIISLIAFMINMGLLYYNHHQKPHSSFPDINTFPLADEQGQIHYLSEWQGKVILINFWATWCPPCLTEIPDLIKFQNQYQQQGVQVIGIAMDTAENVQKFRQSDHIPSAKQINYPILINEIQAMMIMKNYGNPSIALPYSIILDKSGNIHTTHLGILNYAKMQKNIKPLLN